MLDITSSVKSELGETKLMDYSKKLSAVWKLKAVFTSNFWLSLKEDMHVPSIYMKACKLDETFGMIAALWHDFFVQPLAPLNTTLEGVLLGSFKVVWVGGRTVASAIFAVLVLNFTNNLSMGLTGTAFISYNCWKAVKKIIPLYTK